MLAKSANCYVHIPVAKIEYIWRSASEGCFKLISISTNRTVFAILNCLPNLQWKWQRRHHGHTLHQCNSKFTEDQIEYRQYHGVTMIPINLPNRNVLDSPAHSLDHMTHLCCYRSCRFLHSGRYISPYILDHTFLVYILTTSKIEIMSVHKKHSLCFIQADRRADLDTFNWSKETLNFVNFLYYKTW